MTPMDGKFGRRKFLTVAAGASCGLFGGGPASAAQTVAWNGIAMGGGASLRLAAADTATGHKAIAACLAELSRLEDIFSLYRRDSTLSRLNRSGFLRDPPAELLELLALGEWIHGETGGAFDPTVQPLWDHFATRAATGVGVEGIPEAVLDRIGWNGVSFDHREVRLLRPGMAITMNGIAQGFISDRIGALLRRMGFRNVLVDMGEIAAIGGKDQDQPWRVGLSDPDGSVTKVLELSDGAIATSAPSGTLLSKHVGHIFDPRTGASQGHWGRVSVTAGKAAVADGFSTAFCLMSGKDIEDVVRRNPSLSVDLG